VLDRSDTAYALLDDGVLGDGLLRDSGDRWGTARPFAPDTFAACAGNLKRDDDAGCFDTGIRVAEVPTYARTS
jgi:hypothetical protein